MGRETAVIRRRVHRSYRSLTFHIRSAKSEWGPASTTFSSSAATCHRAALHFVRQSTHQPPKTRLIHALVPRLASLPLERIHPRPALTAVVAPAVGTYGPSHVSVVAGSRRATYKSLLVRPKPGPSRAVRRYALSDPAIALRYEVYLGVVYSVKLFELLDKGFDQPLVVVVRRSSCPRTFARLFLS